MKKRGEFLQTKAKHKAKQQNSDKLKLLKQGQDVEILAFDELGIKNFKISITPPERKFAENYKVLVLYGEGKSKHLRIMDLIEDKGSSIYVKNSIHAGWIPSNQFFGHSYGEVVQEKKCLSCTKLSQKDFSPFCSKNCRLADLGSWLDGSYSIKTEDSESSEDNG